MKKMILILAVIAFTATAEKATAQVRLNVNVNLGRQPDWGPSGYDYVDYYYLPDIDVYYYVPRRQFVYLSGNHWVFASSLPARYRSYNLYNSYKVVINEPRPYLHHEEYQARYSKYKGWNGNQSINRGNSRYNTYKGRGRNNSNGRGHKRD